MTFLTNSFRFAVVGCCACTPFASIYEAKQALTTVQPQRVVEWFSGCAIGTQWNFTQVLGSGGTEIMVDAANGGHAITGGTSGANRFTQLDLHNDCFHHYSECMSVYIAIGKVSSAANGGAYWGFDDCATCADHSLRVTTCSVFPGCNYILHATDGACHCGVATCVAIDTNFHTYKIEAKSCSGCLTVDGGCVDATDTTCLPTSPMGPSIIAAGRSCTNKTTTTTYLEAYNT